MCECQWCVYNRNLEADMIAVNLIDDVTYSHSATQISPSQTLMLISLLLICL